VKGNLVTPFMPSSASRCPTTLKLVEKEQGGGVKRKLEEITGAFKTLSEIELKDQAGNAIDLDDDKAKELSLKIKSIRNVQNLMSDLGISNMKSLENEM